MTSTTTWLTAEQNAARLAAGSGRAAGAEGAESADETPTFGAAELAYALSLTEGPARQQAELYLQVDSGFVTEQIAALGASSLLARGQLSVDGDELRPRGAIRLLIAVLQSAVRYTEIALVNENGTEAAVYLQSPGLSVFLQPAALSTWVMVVKAPAVDDATMLKELIDNNLLRHPLGVAYFGTETAESPKIHLFVRASEGGTWDVADVENAETEFRSDGESTADLLERLAVLVKLPVS